MKKKSYLLIFILNRCKKKFTLGWSTKCQKDFKRSNTLSHTAKPTIYTNVHVYDTCFYSFIKNIQVLCINFAIYSKHGSFQKAFNEKYYKY